MAIKHILIDLDGTLTDPKVGIHTSIRYAMDKLGFPLAADLNIDWTIGPPLKASLAKLLATQDDALAEQALLAYRERFSVTGLFENEVYPSVAQTLNALKEDGYRLFVATAKPTIYAKRILDHFDLSQYFVNIYGSELTGERTNKAELIHYILEREQLNSEECLMVGDRQYDVLGIEAVAVTYGYGTPEELKQAQPKAMITQFSELLEYVEDQATQKKVS
jgi:phosphoglycolate phosphatase